MTQDKIFISIERTYGASNGQVIAMTTPHTERQSINDIEYIRKDALLEWAKVQKAWLKQGYKKVWKNDDTLNGGRLMLDKLINKIESL